MAAQADELARQEKAEELAPAVRKDPGPRDPPAHDQPRAGNTGALGHDVTATTQGRGSGDLEEQGVRRRVVERRKRG